MFIINITYKQDLSAVDQWLAPHVQFLEKYYHENIFLLSGRKNPRTGGIILAKANSKAELEAILQQDPFYVHEIADYEIIEFTLTNHHPQLQTLIETYE